MPLPPRIVRASRAIVDRLAHVVELADADHLGRERAGVLEPAQVQRKQEGLVELDGHVGELLLGELEPRDRPVELLAVDRVVDRGLQAVAGGADHAEDDPEPGLGQARQRALEPGDLGEHRGLRAAGRSRGRARW